MEKFVIEGGYPLSGTVRPAGNKNAALPILAASLLTEEEVVISNVPRIRDVESMLALLEDLGVGGQLARRPRGRAARREPDEHRDRLRARQPHPGILPRRGATAGARRRGPHGAAGRRLHRPPPPRPPPGCVPRAGRADRGRPQRLPHVGPRRPACLRVLHGRGQRDGYRERLDGRGADARHHDDQKRRLGAARAGSRAPAGCDGRADRRHRVERPHRARQGPAERRPPLDRARPHRGRQLHGAGGGDRWRAADRRHRARGT